IVFWSIGLLEYRATQAHRTRDQIPPGTWLGIVAVATLVGAGLWCGRLVRVRIRHSDLVAEYQAWNVVVRYADIVDMNLVPQYWSPTSMSYSSRDVIVLRRRHGFPLVLRDFGDAVDEPFNELQRRWSTWMDHVHPHWRDTPPLER
ncbi:MAG TPA: hypothetical protein VKR38_03995, partial [Usitatibacter sp.]|nr:hypothetical protein [Usitatibacter sp.]